MAKVKTALGDMLDYLDRVESRNISHLSISKIRERVKERLPLEKERIIRFAKASSDEHTTPYDGLFDEVFESNKASEDGE